MIKAIIFDCFGVIISDALQVVCDELRLHDPNAADEIRRIITLNNRGLMEPTMSSQQIAAILGITVAEYRQKIEYGEAKDTHILDYILELKQTYKIAMLSNIGAVSLTHRFEVGELESHFDVVVASGEIGHAKPEPQAYEIVAARLGVMPGECVFTDDRNEYCAGARAVGVHTILYTDYGHFRTELEALLSQPGM